MRTTGDMFAATTARGATWLAVVALAFTAVSAAAQESGDSGWYPAVRAKIAEVKTEPLSLLGEADLPEGTRAQAQSQVEGNLEGLLRNLDAEIAGVGPRLSAARLEHSPQEDHFCSAENVTLRLVERVMEELAGGDVAADSRARLLARVPASARRAEGDRRDAGGRRRDPVGPARRVGQRLPVARGSGEGRRLDAGAVVRPDARGDGPPDRTRSGAGTGRSAVQGRASWPPNRGRVRQAGRRQARDSARIPLRQQQAPPDSRRRARGQVLPEDREDRAGGEVRRAAKSRTRRDEDGHDQRTAFWTLERDAVVRVTGCLYRPRTTTPRRLSRPSLVRVL